MKGTNPYNNKVCVLCIPDVSFFSPFFKLRSSLAAPSRCQNIGLGIKRNFSPIALRFTTVAVV